MRARRGFLAFVVIPIVWSAGCDGCGGESGSGVYDANSENLSVECSILDGGEPLIDASLPDTFVDGDISDTPPDVDGADSSSDATDGADVSDAGLDVDAGPVDVPTELETTNDARYVDLGPAPVGDGFRSLFGFRLRNESQLDAKLATLYAPADPNFRKYLTQAEFLASHAPTTTSVSEARALLQGCGFAVPEEAANRLLLEFTGTVGQFNACFSTNVHLLQRVSNPSVMIYGVPPPSSITLPSSLAASSLGILTLELPAPTGTLPGEAGSIVNQPPGSSQYEPAAISKAYHVDELDGVGAKGAGSKIGIVGTNHFKFKDVQSFWQSFAITRADPTIVATMEPLVSRSSETTAAIEWAGALAPLSEIVVYSGPDFSATSLLYTFNEAIGRAETDVVTMSHGRRESLDGTPRRLMYEWSAKMGAALGTTVIAASGDDMNAELPSVATYVTAVGGSELILDGSNARASETYWAPLATRGGGTGNSLTIGKPGYQALLAPLSGSLKRATVDVSVTAREFYWVYWLGAWVPGWGGTELSSPVFAGMLARVQSHRQMNGKPRMGCINPALYTTASVSSSFYDITSGSAFVSQEAKSYSAGAGWDYPTGFGAPNAFALAQALP